MFDAIIVTPDESLAEGLERFAVDSGQVTVYRTIEQYPTPYELVRLMNACDPQLMVIDLSDWERARPLLAKLRASYSKTAILGFGGGWKEEHLERYAAAGVNALMQSPITLEDFRNGVAQAVRSVRGTVRENVIAFFPAKAGSGCSLTAFHVASCVAERHPGKVILIETDLHSATLNIRLDLNAPHYVQDVLQNPSVLSRAEWGGFLVQRSGLDLLLADSTRREIHVQWDAYFDLIEFVAASYDYVFLDLPEVVSDSATELLQRAGKVCLVTTLSRVAIELARRKTVLFDENGLQGDRLSVVANRAPFSERLVEELEELLDRKVAGVLPEDADSLQTLELEGQPVTSETELGRAYLKLAAVLLGEPVPAEAEEPKKPKSRLAAILGR